MAGLKKFGDDVQLLDDLKVRIQTARTRVALAVNREVIALYWNMGTMIVERQQQHGWGMWSLTASAKTCGRSSRITKGSRAQICID